MSFLSSSTKENTKDTEANNYALYLILYYTRTELLKQKMLYLYVSSLSLKYWTSMNRMTFMNTLTNASMYSRQSTKKSTPKSYCILPIFHLTICLVASMNGTNCNYNNRYFKLPIK